MVRDISLLKNSINKNEIEKSPNSSKFIRDPVLPRNLWIGKLRISSVRN